MTTMRFHAALAALCAVASATWSATAAAQFIPAPTTTGAGTGAPNAIHERLYPGIPTGGILTTEKQGRASVQLGSGASVAPPPRASAVLQPAPEPLPSTSFVPQPGSTEPPGPQGLYTAPSEQDPLGRITP